MTALAAGAADVKRYITRRVPFAEPIGQFESYLKPETKVFKVVIEL